MDNVADELAQEALELGSKDNVSVAVVLFEQKLRKLFAAAEKTSVKKKAHLSLFPSRDYHIDPALSRTSVLRPPLDYIILDF